MRTDMKLLLFCTIVLWSPCRTNVYFSHAPGKISTPVGSSVELVWTLSFNYTPFDDFTIFDVNQTLLVKHGGVGPCTPYDQRASCVFQIDRIGFSLSSVTDTDAGNYTCNWVTQHSGFDTNVINSEGLIYVIAQPTNAVIPALVVIENDTASLQCLSSATSLPVDDRPNPELLFTWSINGTNITGLPPERHTINGPQLTVTNVKRTDAVAAYSCQSEEPGGLWSSISQPVNINVTYIPGESSTLSPTIVKFENVMTDIELECHVTDVGNPQWHRYRWTKDGDDLLISTDTHIIRAGTLSVSQHDGNWTCRAVNTIGEGQPADISLTVYKPPLIHDPPINPSLTPDAEDVNALNVICNITGKPAPGVVWTHEGGALPLGVEIELVSNTTNDKLTTVIQKLKWKSGSSFDERKDSGGLYTCTGTVLNETTHFDVTVDAQYRPGDASATISHFNEFEGTEIVLQCTLQDEGNPKWHNFRWIRDGVDFSNTTTDSLIIPAGSLSVSQHDGVWRCSAVNSLGEGSPASINVTVYAYPQHQNLFPGNISPVAEESASLDILCSIQGKPQPSVTWTYNGGSLPIGVLSEEEADTASGKLTTVNRRLRWTDDSTLEQRRLTGGNYTCTGEVLSETAGRQVDADVHYGPYNTAIDPHNITVVENDTLMLTCGANCNPICSYSWIFDGAAVPSDGGELPFDQIKRDNHGWYTCEAGNTIGQGTKLETYIVVSYPPGVDITIYPEEVLQKGMDVTVLCAVDSRPPDNTITWTNVTGGHPPYYDDSSNSTHSWITITDIDILDTGRLRCTADNQVSGSPRSLNRYMEVFGPARVHQTFPPNNRTGAGVGDWVSFQVSIIARPIPFQGNWSLMFVPENFTAELTIPAGVNLTVSYDLATLVISNVTAEHFGNYSLHTSNLYGGWDTGDVVFELFASGPPSRPKSFQADRVTAVSITVKWMTGFDGGLPQTFTITYTNTDSGDEKEMSDIPDECLSEGCIMQRKITEGIADGAQYELQIRADNGKGQAMGDTITASTPVRASLPQPAKISLGDTDAEITFTVIGQLTDVTIHHCVEDTDNCEDDKFPILTPQQDNQGRGRRQATDTMYNFSQTVDLVDPSASSFAFQFMLHDGDDIIHNTASIVIDRKGPNIGAIVGGVIGGLLLAALVVVLVVLWRKGIIFQKEKDVDHQPRHPIYDDAAGGDFGTDRSSKPIFNNDAFEEDFPGGPSQSLTPVGESLYHNSEKGGILVSNFTKYVDDMLRYDDPFEEEYKSLPQGKLFDWEVAQSDELKLKNRFKNILAYDRNRVLLKLQEDDPFSDYINASYIKGYEGRDKMIAALGPMPLTKADFWRMIWEKDVPLIVMLTNCVELGGFKCEQYWPKTMAAGTMTIDDYKVTTIQEDVWPDYTIRSISLVFKGETRKICHCHFTVWPDHGVPECGTALLAFRRIVNKKRVAGRYTVVHCSAGVGRTGTLISIDYLIKQAEKEQRVDVFGCVEELRMQRIHMVQTRTQYVFIHKTLSEYFTTGPTTFFCSDFPNIYTKLTKPSKTGSNRLSQQLQVLDRLSPEITDAVRTTPLDKTNINKNRDPDIIPLFGSRVFLQGSSPGRTDYINAVHVNACRKKDAFIVSQVPLEDTIIDFWRLMVESGSSTIVLLVTDQQFKTMPKFIPTMDNRCVVSNNQMIQFRASTDMHGYREFDFALGPVPATENVYMNYNDVSQPVASSDKPAVPPKHLKLFLVHLAENKQTLDPKATLNVIDDVNKWSKAAMKNRPLTVVCWDGATYSGQFVACCNLVEMMSTEQEVDVYRVVKQIRDKRPQFVRDLVQYKGLHDIVKQYLQDFALYANLI